jgi:hypothetical protein
VGQYRGLGRCHAIARQLPIQLLGTRHAYGNLPPKAASYARRFRGLGGMPYTLRHGATADPPHVKVFGCTAYLHLEGFYKDKLSSKTPRCMFIG